MDYVFKDEEMLLIEKKAKRFANFNAPILITGETGTGKEIIAHIIYKNGSRKDRPFVTVNCAAIPNDLMESSFFGSVKGSYTNSIQDVKGYLEEAGNGIIFLDELVEMPMHLQSKLLRVIDEKKYRKIGSMQIFPVCCRIICATNKDPEKSIEKGLLREDLYHRLNTLHIHIPPLRERVADIPALAEFLVNKSSAENNLSCRLSQESIDKLCSHWWYGNVRELSNVIHKAVVLAEGEIITPNLIEINTTRENPNLKFEEQRVDSFLTREPSQVSVQEQISDSITFTVSKPFPHWDDIKCRYVAEIVNYYGGNIKRTAKVIRIGRQTIYNIMKENKLCRGEFGELAKKS